MQEDGKYARQDDKKGPKIYQQHPKRVKTWLCVRIMR